jgi:hypothetical protein
LAFSTLQIGFCFFCKKTICLKALIPAFSSLPGLGSIQNEGARYEIDEISSNSSIMYISCGRVGFWCHN